MFGFDRFGESGIVGTQLKLESATANGIARFQFGNPRLLTCIKVKLLMKQLKIGRATSELQSLMRISYAVFCLKKKNNNITEHEAYPVPNSVHLILSREPNTLNHTDLSHY